MLSSCHPTTRRTRRSLPVRTPGTRYSKRPTVDRAGQRSTPGGRPLSFPSPFPRTTPRIKRFTSEPAPEFTKPPTGGAVGLRYWVRTQFLLPYPRTTQLTRQSLLEHRAVSTRLRMAGQPGYLQVWAGLYILLPYLQTMHLTRRSLSEQVRAVPTAEDPAQGFTRAQTAGQAGPR